MNEITNILKKYPDNLLLLESLIREPEFPESLYNEYYALALTLKESKQKALLSKLVYRKNLPLEHLETFLDNGFLHELIRTYQFKGKEKLNLLQHYHINKISLEQLVKIIKINNLEDCKDIITQYVNSMEITDNHYYAFSLKLRKFDAEFINEVIKRILNKNPNNYHLVIRHLFEDSIGKILSEKLITLLCSFPLRSDEVVSIFCNAKNCSTEILHSFAPKIIKYLNFKSTEQILKYFKTLDKERLELLISVANIIDIIEN